MITIKLTVNKQLFEVDIIDGIVSYTFISDGTPNILLHSLEGEGETIISEIQVEENDVPTHYEKTYTNMLSGDIVDFSLDNPNGRKYIGQYSDHNPIPSTDYNKYVWRLSQGDQGIKGPRGKDAVTVSLETQASAYEYTADGELGPVKSRSIQAWHNAVLSGAVYYEFIVNGSTKQNTTNGVYMYNAPENYSDMPQTVEVKIREGNNSSSVLATDFITIVGTKPGLDGGDAYTVMLDNESHTFGGDVNNALASSLDIEVISYKGTDRIIASVGDISGLPSGMTVGVVNNNTVSPKISFTVTTSMTSPNGTIAIPITVDGKVFNKIFTYSISFKGDTGGQGPRGLQGLEGPEGKQGIEGAKGTDGKSSYTHIAYATGDQGQTFSHDTFPQATHIGMYVSNNQNSSGNWRDYKWTLIKGKDGARGLEGPKGDDGLTPYFHTAWANSADGKSGFSTTVSAGKLYLGTVTTFEPDDPTDYRVYSWTLIKGDKGDPGPQGIQGPAGSNGQSQYVHIRYSANSNGSGMDTKPSSTTKYVGIAVTNSATAPTYTGFTWSKYIGEDGSQGAQGPQGVPGKNGTNGKTTYTWVRYADTPTSGMNQYPDGKKYIGLAFNKETQTESNNYSDYKWSLMPQNIEVGGRNLLLKTNESLKTLTIGGWGDWVVTRETSPLNGDLLTNKIVEKGKTYTFSTYLDATKSSYPVNIFVRMPNSSVPYRDFSSNKIDAGSSGLAFVTFTVPNDATEVNLYVIRFSQSGTPNQVVSFKQEKLEKGNIATDWSPAPEDIQSQIDGKASAEDLDETIRTIETESEKIASLRTDVDITKNNFLITHTDEYVNKITTTESSVDGLDKRVVQVEETKENIDTFFQFDDAFTIGKSNAQTKLRMTNDEIQFLDGETKGTYISGNTMVSQNITIQDKLNLTKHTMETEGDVTVIRFTG